MKQITITVSVDGNELSRNYEYNEFTFTETWGERVESMLETIEKSKEVKF